VEWLDAVKLLVQKGFNTAAGYVGLKLTVLDADPSSGPGVSAIGIGAALLMGAAIIEYLAWSRSTRLITEANKQIVDAAKELIAKRPGA
jgi:hypothetical protein